LSREEFDSIEFDAAASGDHAAAARQMSMLAATGSETAGMPRAEAFLRAGEQWLLADEPAEAATGFRRAMADGGPVFVDPRAGLARALFQLGRNAEAQAIIHTLNEEGPTDPRICDMIAELLVERNDLPAALEWATAGVRLCLSQGRPPQAGDPADEHPASEQPADEQQGEDLPGEDLPREDLPGRSGDESELRLLLSLRYRIRNDLGLAEDRYDHLLDEK
jgi:hypothetical protein